MDSRTDAQLIAASRHDDAAFRELYDRYARPLHAFFARRTRDERVAVELTAETFAQAWLSRKRFKDVAGGTAGPWLFTIARRVLVRSVRHARVEDEGRARLRVALPPIPASPEDAWLDGLDADLERALAELPEAHRRDALQRGWHGDLAPRRLPRRMVAIAVALLAVGAGVAAGASLLKSPAEEQTGFLAGTTLFRGSDVSCAAVGESAFRCTLPDTPTGETFGASPFPGMKVETVGIDRDVDGGCVSVSADGRVWDCYLGEEAVRRGIIGPGLLGAYSPGPAAA